MRVVELEKTTANVLFLVTSTAPRSDHDPGCFLADLDKFVLVAFHFWSFDINAKTVSSEVASDFPPGCILIENTTMLPCANPRTQPCD